MHILEVLSAKQSNGVVSHLRLLVPVLRARGHRVTILTRTDSPFAAEFSAAGFETLASDLHRWPLDEVNRIAAWARAECVDVVHTHMSRSNNFGLMLKLKTRIPCVMTAHALIRHPHWLLADHVIAVSASTAHWHRRNNRVPTERLTTVLNFIDPDRLTPAPEARAALRAEWGIAEGEVLLGTVGEISARKGQDVLLQALKRLDSLKIKTPLRLVVVGKGQDAFAQKLQQTADTRIIWAGYRTDIADVFSALEGFVLASRQDPCPMAVIEALAAGLPVVGSRVDGIPEFVEEGRSGFLARPGDSADLAHALNAFASLTSTERKQFGQAGRAFVLANATATSQVPKIEDALARGGKRRRRGSNPRPLP